MFVFVLLHAGISERKDVASLNVAMYVWYMYDHLDALIPTVFQSI